MTKVTWKRKNAGSYYSDDYRWVIERYSEGSWRLKDVSGRTEGDFFSSLSAAKEAASKS